MKSSTVLAISVLVIACCICSTQAATKPLAKEECKQITSNPTMADNVVEELIRGVSGKIIEYYNWMFKPKSLNAEQSRTFGRPIRKLKNALIPVMFGMGIVFSMIKFIMFLSMKSVVLGMTILMLNIAFVATKIVLFFKGGHATGLVSGGAGYGKDVHVHVHPTIGSELEKPLGGWSDRNNVYKSSYYVNDQGQYVPYNGWPQAVQAYPSQRSITPEEHVKKRSTTVVEEEEGGIEYELPDQMSVVPPTPTFLDVEKLKRRRSIKI